MRISEARRAQRAERSYTVKMWDFYLHHGIVSNVGLLLANLSLGSKCGDLTCTIQSKCGTFTCNLVQSQMWGFYLQICHQGQNVGISLALYSQNVGLFLASWYSLKCGSFTCKFVIRVKMWGFHLHCTVKMWYFYLHHGIVSNVGLLLANLS